MPKAETSGTNIMSVTHAQLKDRMKLLLGMEDPPSVGIVGQPGIGKSQIVKQVSDELGREMVTYIPARRNPNTTTGIPKIMEDSDDPTQKYWAKWVPFEDFKFSPKKSYNLFIDEFTNAPPIIQSCLMSIVLDRKLENFAIPDNVGIVVAGNMSVHSKASFDFIEPMYSRLALFELKPPATEDWIAWGNTRGLSPLVLSFIYTNPSLLAQPPQDALIATPRGWERIGRYTDDKMSNDQIRDISCAFVGLGAGAQFGNWLEIRAKLPEVPDAYMLKDDKFKRAVKENDPAVILYVVTALTQNHILVDKPEQAFPFLETLPQEFQRFSFRIMRTNENWLNYISMNSYDKFEKLCEKWSMSVDVNSRE